MKAIVCEKYGPPSDLVLKDLPALSPGEKEVVIQVKACSLNFPDTLIIQGKYQYKPALPFTPGSDIAGIVSSVGSAVKHLKVGDEVFENVFPKPPKMDYATGASFLMAYGTSYHALKNRAKLQEGETLVVLGASGGVGLAAVELGKQMGARVIACASTQEKIDLCKAYGAEEGINYTEENLKERIKALTDGKGADVIYDPVGDKFAEPALRAIGWEGRYLVVGFAAGEIPKIPLNMKNTMELVQWHAQGKLKPHIHAQYSLEEAQKAMQEMMDRKVRGKIVINCN